ncbi:MAG TPA: hypothetical protein VN944_09990, partial [Nitrospiria bacterium]|nr:hypothetical protein [Nitrospiria bacterium]
MIKKLKDNLLNATGEKLTRPVLFLLILLMAGSTSVYLLKIAVSILKGYNMDPVAGVWTGLSIDLARGEFYRPLFSESMGYGGTRYFPLFFSLQALLLKITGNPILAGQILNISTDILLLIGFYFLLRR